MSATILPQPHGSANRRVSEFLEMALKELEQTPHWFAAYQTRIRRAVRLISEGQVTRIDDNLFRVGSESGAGGVYEVNCAQRSCQCPDYQAHTREQLGMPFNCKHRIAVWLFLRAQEYQQQFDAEWQRFVSETCSGKPQPLDHPISVEEACRILSLHRTNAPGGIEGAARWYWEMPQVAAEVAECERVILLDQRRKQEEARPEAEPHADPAEETSIGCESSQPYRFSGSDEPPLSSEKPVPAQAEESNPQPTLQPVGFFLCTTCRDSGQVQLTNGHVKTCWCQSSCGIDLKAAHDPDSCYYFEVADENAD